MILSLLTRLSLSVEISERIVEEVISPDSKVSITGQVAFCGTDISVIPDFVYKGKEFLLLYLRKRVLNLAIWQTISGAVLGAGLYFRYKRQKRGEEIAQQY